MSGAKPYCIVCRCEFTRVRFMQRTCSPICAIAWAKSKEDEAKARNIQKRPAIKKEHPEFIRNRALLNSQLILIGGQVFCQRCKRFGVAMSTHHIIYRSEKPNHEHLHNIRNLIKLCNPCHAWIREAKSNRDKLVEERNLTELFGNSILSKKAI